MRRLSRICVNVTTMLSLLLFVTTVVLWVRTYRAAGDWSLSRNTIVKSSAGKVLLITTSTDIVYVADDGDIEDFRKTAQGRFHLPGVERFHVARYDGSWTVTGARHWALAFVAGLPLAARGFVAVARARRRRRTRAGLCSTCGYDLRASPDRCPECGAVPKMAT